MGWEESEAISNGAQIEAVELPDLHPPRRHSLCLQLLPTLTLWMSPNSFSMISSPPPY